MPRPDLPRLLLAAACLAPALPAPGDAADMLSHRAAYRLSLAPGERAGGLSALRGALVIEWRADCAGAVSQQRLAFVARSAASGGISYDVRSSSLESADSNGMRFTMRSFDDGKPAEEYAGRATTGGAGGEVRYTTPGERTLGLPGGTLFPTAHLRALIDAAEHGQRFVAHTVFDGSGPDALNRVTAVIGAARPPEGDAPRTWPVALAYYDQAKGDETPQFQLSFALAADGVLRHLTLDYGDFALNAELEELQRFDPPSCE